MCELKQIHLHTTTNASVSPEVSPLTLVPDVSGVENKVINLYPNCLFETWEGFGGAITDAAGYVYSLMSDEQKQELLKQYFSPEWMDYRIVRIHIDSCDFSTGLYEAVSDPNDETLATFDFSRTEKYILPMLIDAERAAGRKLEIMLSPWSPPAFMKTNGSRIRGGSLKPKYAARWADYICRYIREFQTRGFRVTRISIQNEPKAVQSWDSCVYSAAEEKAFLRDELVPALKRHGMQDVEVFIWDHNKERAFERAAAIIDETTQDMVAGVACHWYSGDHFDALSLLRSCYPQLKLIISESCIEFSKFAAGDQFANAARLSHEIIGDLNHGMSAFYDWNLLLDGKGGPNHVNNLCQAPFLYDVEKHTLIPQDIARHFWHFSHFIQPGSRRIGMTKYSDLLDATAWKRPDGHIVLILLNKNEQSHRVNLRLNGQIAAFDVPAQSICTAELS